MDRDPYVCKKWAECDFMSLHLHACHIHGMRHSYQSLTEVPFIMWTATQKTWYCFTYRGILNKYKYFLKFWYWEISTNEHFANWSCFFNERLLGLFFPNQICLFCLVFSVWYFRCFLCNLFLIVFYAFLFFLPVPSVHSSPAIICFCPAQSHLFPVVILPKCLDSPHQPLLIYFFSFHFTFNLVCCVLHVMSRFSSVLPKFCFVSIADTPQLFASFF